MPNKTRTTQALRHGARNALRILTHLTCDEVGVTSTLQHEMSLRSPSSEVKDPAFGLDPHHIDHIDDTHTIH